MARKILLADDSVTAQNMGRKILADAGYEVITVNNGSAALKKIAETKPDLIVLDVYMPGYSGLEVCQRLKEVKETARIPVLLTVGKLEPFKPEEARRVRAEGYIVKPFEASELLSALSKLEDRVVPRAESAKPGRFARAIAAVEEGRGDEKEAADSADDGWRSRIGFPSKKKKKQEDQDESEIYNPVNRDLRTVVERPAPRGMAPREEGRLDVAALAAAAGLPKDVTPEELAALAAAAAQVQAAVDGKEPVAAPPQSSEVAPRVEEEAEAKVSEAKTEIPAEATAEPKTETKTESQPEAPAVPQAAQPEVGEVAAGATFAQQVVDEAAAAPVNVSAKESKPAASVRDFDVIAVPALQSDDASAPAAAGSGNGSGRTQPETEKKNAEEKHSDETAVPVTMAAAAGAGYIAAGSTTHRWTAVPVAIATEEAAVSLELEMQKAYAAFAAAEANQPGFVASPPATPPVENSISAAMVEAPASPAPDEEEIARTLRDVAHASAEAVDSALAKLEAVVEGNVNSVPGVTQAEESSPKPVPNAAETHTEIVAAAVRDLEAKREQEAKELEAREREARELEAREQEAKEREAKEIEAREREAREQEAKEREAREIEAREREARELEAREQAAREQEAKEREAREMEAREREARELEAREQAAREQEAKEREAREIEAREREARELEAREQAAREQEAKEREAKEVEARERAAREQAEAAAAQAAAEAASTAAMQGSVAAVSEAPVQAKGKIAGGEMAEKRESDIAATTAAAWASWRQIRESGDKSKPAGSAKASQQDEDDEEYPELPPDRAAMAAAAGAEKTPSVEEAPEASADDPEAIANIVDKVLADLRPKIAEEISKKLKKK
ncbi:MAG: response regulator [Terriglobales bacterium]